MRVPGVGVADRPARTDQARKTAHGPRAVTPIATVGVRRISGARVAGGARGWKRERENRGGSRSRRRWWRRGERQRTMTEWVACPSCGRTLFVLEDVLADVRAATKHLQNLDAPISISVLGCIVNGPGEMADADYGSVGSKAGYITLYRRKEVIKTVPQADGVKALVELLQTDGVWLNPPVEVPSTA